MGDHVSQKMLRRLSILRVNDVKALINTAREYGYKPELISAVDSVNNYQKKVLANKIISWFEAHGGIDGKTLALWGIAFKANTDDIREAAALDIISELTEQGMRIKAYDPVANKNAKQVFESNANVEILEEQYEALVNADVLAVVTDWNQFRNPDFQKIKDHIKYPVVFDGRNLYSSSFLSSVGIEYHAIGRKQ